jgi:alpha-1,2-mannosyltransferase
MSQKRLLTMERGVVGVLAVVVLASGLYFARKSGTNPEVYGNDFNVYYHAAREVMAGGDPYQHSLGDWTPYIYPPLLAELIVPLAILPLPVAAYLWFLISAVSMVVAAWMSASLASERERGAPEQRVIESTAWRTALAGCAVAFVLRFVLDTFNLGQVNAVVAALAVAHVYLYARDRKALSAIALVIAVSIKLTPALLLLYHIAKLRLKFAVACAVLLVAVTALSFLPFLPRGSGAFQTFWSRTVKNEQGYDFAYSGNQSLRGAIARMIDHRSEYTGDEGASREPVDLPTILISIALLALAVFAAARARSELAAAAPFFCCLVLLSPLSWKAHYVILILPAAYLLSLTKAPGRARFLIAAALGAAFLLLNLTGTRVIGLAAAEWADAHSLVVVGALVVFVACVAGMLMRKFGKQPHVC